MTLTLSRETTIVTHPYLSPYASAKIREWAQELDLRKATGRRLTLPQICTIIIEDFAEEYDKTKQQMEEEMP